MLIDFVALDVETANPDLASICQVGIVVFSDGMVADSWESLVNPEDFFDPLNVAIHGIDEHAVHGAPRFVDIAPDIAKLLSGRIVASHTPFDRVAVSRAQSKYQLPLIDCSWLDTAKVCRRAWAQFGQRGYGLAQVASWCGIDFTHHNAREDARAAGLVLIRAVADSGLTVQDWLARVEQPINLEGWQSSRVARVGNANGPLAGEVVVFTGGLSMLRREAADMAAEAGCDVAGSVGKATTLLVVGDQDIRRLAGHEKSSKHRQTEELIGAGQLIRILTERDFRALLASGIT